MSVVTIGNFSDDQNISCVVAVKIKTCSVPYILSLSSSLNQNLSFNI